MEFSTRIFLFWDPLSTKEIPVWTYKQYSTCILSQYRFTNSYFENIKVSLDFRSKVSNALTLVCSRSKPGWDITLIIVKLFKNNFCERCLRLGFKVQTTSSLWTFDLRTMEIPSVFEAAKRSRKEGDVSNSIYFASCPAFTTLPKENEMPNQFIVLVSVFLYTSKSRF